MKIPDPASAHAIPQSSLGFANGRNQMYFVGQKTALDVLTREVHS